MQHPEERSSDQILLMRSHIAHSYNYSGDTSSVDADILRDYNLGVESLADARDKDPKRSIERLPNELLIAIIEKMDEIDTSNTIPLESGLLDRE
ncbi:hypothetical protein PIIN_11074 [Serendipita indica DSM 11827]|uniref:Uncharacterized protein n=1 Tax=Serendipita indica (strain DSM 11827) TaxID=1109443 RepID=G4U0J6_SERID|nr:hypothetical protein PIIN_11074 [Serendipita indica DSM 11827]